MALVERTWRQPVGLLWDIENCPVPNDVHPEDVAVNICMALKSHPLVAGPVTVFSAYGDFNQFPRKLREGCQRTGVNLIDVPNGRKDAADKAILVDLFLFAIDNPPPSTIFLISGDVDFSAALHKLSQRGYTIVLAHGAGSGQGVSLALQNAASCVWQWQALARGQGLIPPREVDWNNEHIGAAGPPLTGVPAPALSFSGSPVFHPPWVRPAGPSRPVLRPVNSSVVTTNSPPRLVPTAALLRSKSAADTLAPAVETPLQSRIEGRSSSPGLHVKAESVVASTLQSEAVPVYPQNESGWGVDPGQPPDPVQPPLGDSQPVRSLPGSTSDGQWTQPGDLEGLKVQLVDLLNRNGGRLDLVRVPTEYRKTYGRPLFLSEYGALKLNHLLVRMGDPLGVSGFGVNKRLYLTRTRTPRSSHVIRHPSRTKANEYWSGDVSSSGEGEHEEHPQRGQKTAAEERGVAAESPEKAPSNTEGQTVSEKKRLRKKEALGKAEEAPAATATDSDDADLLAPLIEVDKGKRADVSIPSKGAEQSERESALRRRSMERIQVVDLLSGESLQRPELWSFDEEAAAAAGNSSLDSDESTTSVQARMDERRKAVSGEDFREETELPGDETLRKFELLAVEDSGGVDAREKVCESLTDQQSTEDEEDEEQAGWRMRSSSRESTGEEESSPVKQPDLYWQMLRAKKQQARGSEKGVGSDGETSPGTPEISESR